MDSLIPYPPTSPYKWGQVEFSIEQTTPHPDECIKLLTEVLARAVNDYSNYLLKVSGISKDIYITAA